jgi:hypothetical protein
VVHNATGVGAAFTRGRAHTTTREALRVAMTSDSTDLYAVLGLTPQATQEEIRRAYRTLMRQNHPDTRAPDDLAGRTGSNAKLQQVIAAYTTLGDPVRRTDYDQRSTRQQASTPTLVRPVMMAFPPNAVDQPPIQAGPVHWHHGPT